jgi:VWFA-related protein
MRVFPRLICAAALVVPVVCPRVVVAQAGPQRSATSSGGITRSVNVNAFDASGTPVDDLTQADFVVKEGGKTRNVVGYRPAKALMQIALIVDDNGTGLFRAPLYRFVQRLQGKAEFAVVTVVGQPLKLTDYTTDAKVLSEVLLSLSARPGTSDGGQLLQGIYDAARELEKREAPRPVIIALTIPGDEHSTLPARHVLDKLKDSGASLHVFLVANSAARQLAPTGTKPSALLEENFNLGEVLGDGSKQSGGRREEIIASAGAVAGLERLAEELLHQFVIDYDLPSGTKPSDRISVSVKRKGVSLRSPARIPNR